VAGAITRLPNTPAGRIAGDYLRAFNSGEPDTVRRFFETEAVSDSTRPTGVRVERYKSIYADIGRLELVSVDSAAPASITITVSSERGHSMAMTFEVERTGANRLTSLRLELSR
jgi:hypothetical protein